MSSMPREPLQWQDCTILKGRTTIVSGLQARRLPRPDCVATRNDKKEFVELLEFVGFLEFIGFLESGEFFDSVEMTRLVHPERSGLARGKRGLLPDGMTPFLPRTRLSQDT